MCGIAGIVRFDRPAEASRAQVQRMQRLLLHRGPDDRGLSFGSHAALAHTRLAMIDQAGGAQPRHSDDGRYTLVYNGELYNDAELRAELYALTGRPWASRCDAETVLEAWRQWGPCAVERFDGMFALFIWDEQERCGYAVRDRLGVKPLAYRADVGFAFASEAKALVELGSSPPRANADAVLEYLVAPAFSGVQHSMFESIEYLAPGHWLRVDADGVKLHEYWRWSPSADPSIGAPQLREALAHAVERCTIADAPLGVFFSGGLDSTLIAAHARRHRPALPALTVTFEGQDTWGEGSSAIVVSNDTPHAIRAAEELGLTAHTVRFDRATLSDELDALARVDDALPAWEQELSQRGLARAAAQHGLKGILVGDAADETHYGYHFLLDAIATQSPRKIVERLGVVPIAAGVDRDPITRFDSEYRTLVAEAGLSFDEPHERIAATTELIVRRWLPRLLHNGDVHCMAFGVEPRVPFAANAVLACAQAVGPERALAGGVEKAVLRRAAMGLVPEAIATRRKSALPKDQAVGVAYRRLLTETLAEPHPLVSTLVDIPQLQQQAAAEPMNERTRGVVFRVLCLQRWAMAYGVGAP